MLVRLEYNTQEYVLWKLLPLNNIHHIVAFTVCGTTSTRHSVRIEPQYAWLCPSLYINSQIHKFKPSSTLWTSQPQQKTFHNNTHVRVVHICIRVFSNIFLQVCVFFHRFSCCFSIAYTVSEHILSWFFSYLFFPFFLFFNIFIFFLLLICC